MKTANLYSFLLTTLLILSANSVNASEGKIMKLENPISVEYLQKNLRKTLPRLVLNSEIEKELREKLKTDPVIQNYFKAIKLNAKIHYRLILTTPTKNFDKSFDVFKKWLKTVK